MASPERGGVDGSAYADDAALVYAASYRLTLEESGILFAE